MRGMRKAMANIWERDGLKLTFLPNGNVAVEVDVAALAAANELQPIGSVRVYEVDTKRLGKNIVEEAGRLVNRIKKAVKK